MFKVIAQSQVDGTNWIYWLDGTNAGVTSDILMYRSTNLTEDWELVADDIPRSNGTNMWGDPDSPDVPAFYRPAITNDFTP